VTSAIGRRVQQQLAVVRVIVDEVERSLHKADPFLESELRDQLADALEVLSLSLRQRAHFPEAEPDPDTRRVTPTGTKGE
jgi:hypothetical protein